MSKDVYKARQIYSNLDEINENILGGIKWIIKFPLTHTVSIYKSEKIRFGFSLEGALCQRHWFLLPTVLAVHAAVVMCAGYGNRIIYARTHTYAIYHYFNGVTWTNRLVVIAYTIYCIIGEQSRIRFVLCKIRIRYL